MIRPQLAPLLVGVLSLACAGPLTDRPASDEERRTFNEAVATLPDDPASAESALEAFLARWPASPLADDAGVKLGEIALARADTDTALQRFERVVGDHPGSDRADLARLRVAQIQLRRGNAAGAEEILERARLSRLSRSERAEAYRVLADVAADPVSRLRRLAKVREHSEDPNETALTDADIDEILVRINEKQLERAADQIGDKIPAARIAIRRGELALDRGDAAAARKALDRARAVPAAPATERGRVALEDRLKLYERGPEQMADLPTFAELAGEPPPSTVGAVGTLGVVLPLTGPFARFGEESLEGVLLATGIFDARRVAGDAPAIRLLIRDSRGRPEVAAQAVRELAESDDVVAIVGPLLARECEAAAAAAEDVGIPLLALTSREEIAARREQVMRLRTMPREEVELLVEYAMRELGAQTFAILYPADAYGRGLRDLFWDAVELRGGGIVGVAHYDPQATDFADPIRRLVGYVLLDGEEDALLAEREAMMRRARRLPPEEALLLRQEARALVTEEGEPLPPIVDFDALFIPESHEKVVLIAPQLAFHEATGTRLLGPSGWYHPDLVPIARQHVEGALFTAHFYPESPVPFVRSFAERFRETFDVVPDIFAAQGYDAARLVVVQLARGRENRDDVREGLLSTRAYPGVTGVLSMRSDGNASKRPFLLGVKRGRIVQVDETDGASAAIP